MREFFAYTLPLAGIPFFMGEIELRKEEQICGTLEVVLAQRFFVLMLAISGSLG